MSEREPINWNSIHTTVVVGIGIIILSENGVQLALIWWGGWLLTNIVLKGIWTTKQVKEVVNNEGKQKVTIREAIRAIRAMQETGTTRKSSDSDSDSSTTIQAKTRK